MYKRTRRAIRTSPSPRLAGGTDYAPAAIERALRRVLLEEAPALTALPEEGCWGYEPAEIAAFLEGKEPKEE